MDSLSSINQNDADKGMIDSSFEADPIISYGGKKTDGKNDPLRSKITSLQSVLGASLDRAWDN